MEAVYYAARANLQRLLRQHPRLLASPIGPGDRYVDMQRSLDTLHSLGDFCYLFKRSVAEQLGGFDAAYGAGPCWEIDFNTRAARAGFRAIWVADAYVHRVPTPPSRAQTIRRLFTANKQLYQDRFCGLRLRGEKKSYEVHCRGEACEHFAPAKTWLSILLSPRLLPEIVYSLVSRAGDSVKGISILRNTVTRG